MKTPLAAPVSVQLFYVEIYMESGLGINMGIYTWYFTALSDTAHGISMGVFRCQTKTFASGFNGLWCRI